DPAGVPMARRPIYVEARSPSFGVGTLLRTTAEGRLRMNLGNRDAGREFTLTLGPTPGSIEAWPTGMRQLTLQGGRNDLGDLLLPPAPIVVSGTSVIDGEHVGQKVPLKIRIQNGDRWRNTNELYPEWLPGGRFTIRGNCEPGTLVQLLVQDGPHQTIEPIECA